jgi:hypothetical protein
MNLPRSRILKTAKRIRVPATKQIRTIQPELLTAIAVERVAGAIVGIGRGVGVVIGGSAPIFKFYTTILFLKIILAKVVTINNNSATSRVSKLYNFST